MRKGHMEQVERWARFVKANPTKWKKIHTEFINSIFAKNKEVMERLRATPGGEEKIRRLYNKR